MKTAVFLERDGVLNRIGTDASSHRLVPRTFEEFALIPGVKQQLKRLKDAGLLLIVTTNQSGLSQGTLPRRELDLMHTVMRRQIPIDDIFICPHEAADRCFCRKPAPGMFTEAAFKYQLTLEHCFVISNHWKDADAAEAVGAKSVLINSPWVGNGHHDSVVASLEEAVDKVLTWCEPSAYGVGAVGGVACVA